MKITNTVETPSPHHHDAGDDDDDSYDMVDMSGGAMKNDVDDFVHVLSNNDNHNNEEDNFNSNNDNNCGILLSTYEMLLPLPAIRRQALLFEIIMYQKRQSMKQIQPSSLEARIMDMVHIHKEIQKTLQRKHLRSIQRRSICHGIRYRTAQIQVCCFYRHPNCYCNHNNGSIINVLDMVQLQKEVQQILHKKFQRSIQKRSICHNIRRRMTKQQLQQTCESRRNEILDVSGIIDVETLHNEIQKKLIRKHFRNIQKRSICCSIRRRGQRAATHDHDKMHHPQDLSQELHRRQSIVESIGGGGTNLLKEENRRLDKPKSFDHPHYHNKHHHATTFLAAPELQVYLERKPDHRAILNAAVLHTIRVHDQIKALSKCHLRFRKQPEIVRLLSEIRQYSLYSKTKRKNKTTFHPVRDIPMGALNHSIHNTAWYPMNLIRMYHCQCYVATYKKELLSKYYKMICAIERDHVEWNKKNGSTTQSSYRTNPLNGVSSRMDAPNSFDHTHYHNNYHTATTFIAPELQVYLEWKPDHRSILGAAVLHSIRVHDQLKALSRCHLRFRTQPEIVQLLSEIRQYNCLYSKSKINRNDKTFHPVKDIPMGALIHSIHNIAWYPMNLIRMYHCQCYVATYKKELVSKYNTMICDVENDVNAEWNKKNGLTTQSLSRTNPLKKASTCMDKPKCFPHPHCHNNYHATTFLVAPELQVYLEWKPDHRAILDAAVLHSIRVHDQIKALSRYHLRVRNQPEIKQLLSEIRQYSLHSKINCNNKTTFHPIQDIPMGALDHSIHNIAWYPMNLIRMYHCQCCVAKYKRELLLKYYTMIFGVENDDNVEWNQKNGSTQSSSYKPMKEHILNLIAVRRTALYYEIRRYPIIRYMTQLRSPIRQGTTQKFNQELYQAVTKYQQKQERQSSPSSYFQLKPMKEEILNLQLIAIRRTALYYEIRRYPSIRYMTQWRPICQETVQKYKKELYQSARKYQLKQKKRILKMKLMALRNINGTTETKLKNELYQAVTKYQQKQ